MGVFLIMPWRVAMTRLWPFSKFGMVIDGEHPLAGLHLDPLEVDDRDALGLPARRPGPGGP